MEIPKRLKIGNIWYEVGSLTKDAAEQWMGRSSVSDQYIRLSENLSQDQREEIFWHEIVHQVLRRADYHEESANEKLVSCLANGLYQVLKDNQLLRGDDAYSR